MKECSRALRTTTVIPNKHSLSSIESYCFENDPGLLQSSREVEVKRGQFKDKLAVKYCRRVGVGYCFFNITPRRMGAIKSNFKKPVVLVSGYSRDRARRGPAIVTRGIMDRPDLSGRVRGLMSTTTRRRRFFFYFLTLPSAKSFFPSRQCLR